MGDGFAWTIPLIQLCFALLFLAARRAGAPREAGVWSGAYLLNAAAFGVSMLDPLLPSAPVAVAADLLFALAFFRFGDALVVRYDVRPLRTVRIGLLAVAGAAPVSGVAAGSLPLELLGSDLGCALQLAVPLTLIRRLPPRWVDRGLLAVSWLVVAINVARSASVPLTAAGASVETFVGTGYSVLMYADGMVTGIVGGVLALIAVTADLVAGYQREAHVDPLTGLLNRRGLEAALGWTAADALIACDLDHFKRVNDTHGHDTGDRVLAAFAGLVRAVLPAGAVAARVGGEEFVIVLPGCGLVACQAVATRLGVAMARHDWAATGLGWRQTASFGLAAGATLTEAIRLADAQLYAAKRGGRDRVCGPLAA